MEIMKDGLNAAHHAEDYKKEIIEVNRNSMVPIHMVSGGGWAAKIKTK
jgi:alpha-glucosidase